MATSATETPTPKAKSVRSGGRAARKSRILVKSKTSTTAKKVDPELLRAVRGCGNDGPTTLVVMVKLDTKHSKFGQYSVTNRPGSARERVFKEELVTEAQGDTESNQPYRIVSTAANVGVATVEAAASVVRNLMRSSKVTGLKLKGS